MSLNNPQVQFVRYEESGDPDRHFLYITTHFAYSNYEPDGVLSIAGPDSNGRLTVSVKVKKDGLALRLNKAVFHQVELVDLDATVVSSEVKIYEGSTLLTSVILSHDESDTTVKPILEPARYS